MMILKKIGVSFFAVVTILTVSSAAMADARVMNGSGGDYSYEVWQTTDNTAYYLKIWKRDSYGKQNEPLRIIHTFKSTGEALDHFDCYYAGKSLPSCSK
ncbi:MAG: hypothetical protein SAL70_08725 [Scytonema sp. PMC 1070.18]|nr:hypothetical protein [Scytonema sp. PMC 1070.18]